MPDPHSERPAVLVTADFSQPQLNRLSEFADVRVGGWGTTGAVPSKAELIELLMGAEILVVAWEEIDREVLSKSALRYIASVRGGPGANIDLEAAKELGIPVTGTIGREAVPVAEFTFGLMIGFFRFIPETYRRLRSGELASYAPPTNELGWGMEPEDPWLYYRGEDLLGKRLGLIGLGAVGRLVAKRAAAFEMEVVAYDPFIEGCDGVIMTSLEDVMHSDVVSIHARYSKATHHLIGERELSLMPQHGLLVNTARPNIINREALLQVIQSGRIAGAALDVHYREPLDPDDPFLALPNVLCTPHIAGSSMGVTGVQSVQVVDNIAQFAKGGELVNVVNGL